MSAMDHSTDTLLRRIPVVAIVLIGLFVTLAPFFILFGNSLRPADEFLSENATLWPSHLTFEYYASVFGANSATLKILFNSIIVTTLTTIVSVSTGCLVAYGLARLKLPFRLSTIIGLTFLVVRFYPKITIAIPYFVLMRDLGLRDTYAAVVIAHVSMTLPVVVWLMLSFFEEFPRQLEQSAMLDGCGVLRRFFSIVLPLTLPAIVTAGSFCSHRQSGRSTPRRCRSPSRPSSPTRGPLGDRCRRWGPSSCCRSSCWPSSRNAISSAVSPPAP